MSASASNPDRGVIGIDVGTSGCRAVAVGANGDIRASATVALPKPARIGANGVEQDPLAWWRALLALLRALRGCAPGFQADALCLDGTSSTLLLCAPDGAPLGPALMYNDGRCRAEATRIATLAPPDCAARGASSSLAKALFLKRRHAPRTPTWAVHQADWLSGRLLGRQGHGDWNNALKLGFDVERLCWPAWLERLDLEPLQLPTIVAPGTPLGRIDPTVAAETGLPRDLRIHAGTTDSTAAVLATGARAPGDAVTSLGSTLAIKILTERPISAPRFGVYSHRHGDLWLVGGASNSGGAVLRQFFSDAEIATLSATLVPNRSSGLDYYPLPGSGERFPIDDPDLAPRLDPRPASDARFLHGLLEGIARIEAAGYRRLTELGAPRPTRVLTIGGGADNPAWTAIRARLLGVPVIAATSHPPAHGAARLAMH